MRESISIDKDFIGGSENKSLKIKPHSNLRGNVTVQLFKDNKLEREIKTENIVMDWLKAYAFKSLYSVSLFDKKTSFSFDDFSKYVVLFNGEHEDTNPKKALIKDDIVGYIERGVNYSGSDTKKGTYNSKESYLYTTDEGKYAFHIVCDFPTHACNGDITGIGLSSSLTKGSSLIQYRGARNYFNVLSSNCAMEFNRDMNKMFGHIRQENSSYSTFYGYLDENYSQSTNDATFVLSNALTTLKGGTSLTEKTDCHYFVDGKNKVVHQFSYCSSANLANAGTYSSSWSGMWDKNLNIWYRKINFNNDVVTSIAKLNYDFSDLIQVNSMSTSSGTNYAYVTVNYVCRPLSNGNILVLLYFKSLKGTTITGDYMSYEGTPCSRKKLAMQFNSSGEYLSHEVLNDDLYEGDLYKIIPFGEDESILITSTGKAYKFDDVNASNMTNITNEDLKPYLKSKFTNLSDMRALCGNMNDKRVFITDYEGSKVGVVNRCKKNDNELLVTSYTRLPNKVTKTNIHTMKVQYDLIIDDVSYDDYIER